jgi:hypothetical protein
MASPRFKSFKRFAADEGLDRQQALDLLLFAIGELGGEMSSGDRRRFANDIETVLNEGSGAGNEFGEDGRIRRGRAARDSDLPEGRYEAADSRRRRYASDEPPPFSFRPRPGGEMDDPIEDGRHRAYDARIAMDSASVRDWKLRFPAAALVKVG